MYWIRYSYNWKNWEEADASSLGELFRDLQKMCGRCTGKIYRDRPKRFDGPDTPIQCGWVFEKKGYDDTWVEVSTTNPYREWQNLNYPWSP